MSYPIVLGMAPVEPYEPTRETIIVQGESIIRPDAVDGFESNREPGSLVHTILGRAFPDVTLRPASARSGTLRLTFRRDDDSATAELQFASPGIFQLVSAYQSTVEMSFAVTGRITRRLDPSGYWAVEFGYHEVQP